MKYKVHLFAVVRVPVEIEADSQEEAIDKSEKSIDLHTLFDHTIGEAQEREWTDEIAYYLVDEDGDEEHQKTKWWIYRDGKMRPMPAEDLLTIAINSLQELSAWMRFHTGPKDGTKDLLTRALIAITAAGEKPRETWG